VTDATQTKKPTQAKDSHTLLCNLDHVIATSQRNKFGNIDHLECPNNVSFIHDDDIDDKRTKAVSSRHIIAPGSQELILTVNPLYRGEYYLAALTISLGNILFSASFSPIEAMSMSRGFPILTLKNPSVQDTISIDVVSPLHSIVEHKDFVHLRLKKRPRDEFDELKVSGVMSLALTYIQAINNFLNAAYS
jgi:hypothetical protein